MENYTISIKGFQVLDVGPFLELSIKCLEIFVFDWNVILHSEREGKSKYNLWICFSYWKELKRQVNFIKYAIRLHVGMKASSRLQEFQLWQG